MRISVFTREERERKEGEKKIISFFQPFFFFFFIPVLDQIQFNGDLTDSSDEEAPPASVFISRRPGGARASVSAPRMSK